MPHDNNLEVDHLSTRIAVPFRSQPRTGRDYSKIRCFSCGQFGHMQSRCPNPDTSLPFKPAGWFLQSEGGQQRNGGNQMGNSPLDRDLTHTGLHVHHSTPIHHSCIKSSWDSPSPDATITLTVFINNNPYNQE